MNVKKSVREIKNCVNLALTYYKPNKQMYVASDASNFGLVAVILHKEVLYSHLPYHSASQRHNN